jgi:hypothetical protein
MILASHGIIASQIVSVDPDWLAYYNRVIAAGGSLSTTEQNATKTLVADLKSAGIWASMKAIYPMVGASAAACAQNLKSSSFTGTFTSTGWTFASTGATPNGTSAYMDTGINDLNDLGTNATVGGYFNGVRTTGWDMGVYDGSVVSGLTTSDGNTTQVLINIRSGIISSFTDSATFGGMYMGTDNGSINSTYKNNVFKSSFTQLSNGISLKHYLGALNNNGTPIVFKGTRIATAFFGNETLSATNVSNLYTALQEFQTTLSRQV